MITIREIHYVPEKRDTYDYYGFQTGDGKTKYLLECPSCKIAKMTRLERSRCGHCNSWVTIKDNQKPKTFWVPVFLKYPRQLEKVPTGVYYVKLGGIDWWQRRYVQQGDTQVIAIKVNGYYQWYVTKMRV